MEPDEGEHCDGPKSPCSWSGCLKGTISEQARESIYLTLPARITVGFKERIRSMIPVHELRKYDIFLDLEPSELAALARIADVVHAREGEAIIEEGRPARTFYVMDQGNLMVAFKDGRALTLHGAGEVVGWSAIIHPTYYTGTVICLTDCSFIAFPGRELLRLVQSNVATGTKIMRLVSERVANRMPFLAETITRKLKDGR